MQANPQSVEYDLHVTEKSLGEALVSLSRQSGVPLLYPYELAGETGVNPVIGRFTIERALSTLLRGTEFSGGLTQSGVMTVLLENNRRISQEDGVNRGTVRKSLLASVASFAFGANAQAQESANGDDSSQDGAASDRIVVTGSRISKNAFDSPLPLQVIDGEAARAVGLSDIGSIVQQSSVASGFQFDNSVTVPGDVAAAGGTVGASTVSLRGLSADRTLVLLNSRRLAPAGVDGVPTQPDLNLIPASLIERVEILTDGASSVYGSDAVAGVVNVILRDDFDGVEMTAFGNFTEAGGGNVQNYSIIAGHVADRGHILFGAEYYEREQVLRSQRPFSQCRQTVEQQIDTGEILRSCVDFGGAGGGGLNQFQDPNVIAGAGLLELPFDFGAGSGFFVQPAGSALCDETDSILGPGTNTTGVSCEFTVFDGFPDLLPASGFDERYNQNGFVDRQDLVSPLKRYSIFTKGDYELDLFDHATIMYFDASYSNREVDVSTGPGPFNVPVPCSNPFIQQDAVLSAAPTCAAAAGDPDFASLSLLDAPGATLDWLGAIDILGRKETEVSQARGVIGFSGDLGFINERFSGNGGSAGFAFAPGNWRYDIYAGYTRSVGHSTAGQISDERLALSLFTARVDTLDEDGDGNTSEVICGSPLFVDLSDGCVPIDPTAPQLYLQNSLPQDVANYLAGEATNRTLYEQTIVSGYISGDLFRVPAGVVPLVLGLEYREDRIDARNSFLTTSGAGLGGLAPAELNTIGDRSLFEFFLETELPIIKDRPGIQNLTVNASTRWTEESNFGALWTYRVSGVYSPVDYLTFRGSYGTTYRAPNLREQFLADQFNTIVPGNDPCLVLIGAPPVSDPDVITNCELQGADSTLLGAGAGSLPPISVRRGGADDLDAETSRSFTAGFTFDQPWTDAFSFRLSGTYFDIKVKNSVEEPGAGDVLRECLVETPNLESPFCRRIERVNSGDPRTNFIDSIDASFFNVGVLTSKGVDLNAQIAADFALAGQPLSLTIDSLATRQIEVMEDRLGAQDDNLGEIEFPKLQSITTATVGWNALTLLWRARYNSGGIPDDCCTPAFPTLHTTIDSVDGFSDPTTILTSGTIDPDGDGAPGTLAFQSPGAFEVGRVDGYWYHDMSLTFSHGSWTARAGVNNVFDRQPPSLHRGTGQFSRFGVVLGAGLDLYGRSYFLSLSKKF